MSYGYRCKNCGLVGKSSDRENDPIKSVVFCDGCGAETPMSGMCETPPGWITMHIEGADEKDYVPSEHYCSRACLKKHEIKDS